MTGGPGDEPGDDALEDPPGEPAGEPVDPAALVPAPHPVWAPGGPLEGAVEILASGDVEVEGRLPYSSNATMLAAVAGPAGDEVLAVYKPRRGERPLFDFPPGLDRRETAAYELSEALGWGLVPPTVIRDGPLGEGSLQLFVPAHHEHHYFTLHEAGGFDDFLRRICVFDLIANNTDRKSGHCLLGTDGRVYAIDHGLCFHHQFKLRTVLWDYAGETIADEVVADVEGIISRVPEALCTLLDPLELDALTTRARAVCTNRVFPHDPSGRRYPWPLV